MFCSFEISDILPSLLIELAYIIYIYNHELWLKNDMANGLHFRSYLIFEPSMFFGGIELLMHQQRLSKVRQKTIMPQISKHVFTWYTPQV